jgi:hypothetical protein
VFIPDNGKEDDLPESIPDNGKEDDLSDEPGQQCGSTLALLTTLKHKVEVSFKLIWQNVLG